MPSAARVGTCAGTVLIGLSALSPTALSTTATSDGSATVIPTLNVEFYQDLYFGIIVPSATATSTVRVLRGNNNSSICGAGLVCLESGNRARLRVTGAPGYRFSMADPGSTTLSDGQGNTMLVDTFVGAGSANDTVYGKVIRLGNSGVANLNIGATLHVAPNQPVGTYAGTYLVTANYE